VIGGAGENILIGGETVHDLVPAALDAIMREFARTDEDFTTRLTHLLSGDGANGDSLLNPTTVSTREETNSLAGGKYRANWFFVKDRRDVIKPGTLHRFDVITKL
jgi:hypothetical protein